MIHSFQREPYLRRLPQVIDQTQGIQAYDRDNLYPQRADEVRGRSYTTKRSVEILVEFINGEGFEDPALAELILNEEGIDGMTANDVLDMIALDKAPFNGFALHIRYNLNYRIAAITPLEFMYCRLGLPDSEGRVALIRYSTNWERDRSKAPDRSFDVLTYPLFNPAADVVKEQMEAYGFWDYPGQILYWTPKEGRYPLASFDAVFDQAQTQAEIGVFEVSSIQNGFTAATVFKYPGAFENEEKKHAFKKKMKEHIGARGAKSILVVENPTGQELDLIESIQMQDTDKMFEVTARSAKNAIRENGSIPAPLLGQLPENGMFNQQQMQDAYTYYNAITRGHRHQLERLFKVLLKYWKDPVRIASFKIKPQQYLING